MQPRFFFYSIVLSSLGLGVALLSQHVFDMRPCAWCVFQRLLLIIIFAFSIFGYLVSSFKLHFLSQIFATFSVLTSLGGILAAWYQYTVAAKLFSCDLTFADRFMTQSGLDSAIPWLFGIYSTCMDASVHVFGLEYALWALILFAILGLLMIYALLHSLYRS